MLFLKRKSNSTLITALYNINREKQDGRKLNDYISWLLQTLSLDTNYVVFTEEKIADFIPNKKNIKKIITTLEEVPLYHLEPKISHILSDPTYRKRIIDTRRIECNMALYNILMYSKFEWLKRIVQENPFGSTCFFWIDAGANRFFRGLKPTFPNNDKLPVKFLVQGTIYYNNPLPDNYKWCPDPPIGGGFFGGPGDYVVTVSDKTLNYLYNEMLACDMINNEQIALGYVAKTHQELFEVMPNNSHATLPMLKFFE